MLRKAGGYTQVSGDGQSPTGDSPHHVLASQQHLHVRSCELRSFISLSDLVTSRGNTLEDEICLQ